MTAHEYYRALNDIQSQVNKLHNELQLDLAISDDTCVSRGLQLRLDDQVMLIGLDAGVGMQHILNFIKEA
jgi:hypothetical protein